VRRATCVGVLWDGGMGMGMWMGVGMFRNGRVGKGRVGEEMFRKGREDVQMVAWGNL
jgi:hypothetical protein